MAVILNDGSDGLGTALRYGPSELRQHNGAAAGVTGDGVADLIGSRAAVWYRPARAGQGLGEPVGLIEAPTPWTQLTVERGQRWPWIWTEIS